MELFWNAGRLTDIGAFIFALVVTVAIFRVVLAKAYRDEPARLSLPLSWSDALARWNAGQRGGH